jgi:hypothetical protein
MTQTTHYSSLVDLLAKIDFDRRYYSFHEAHRDRARTPMKDAGREQFEAALKAAGVDATYHRKEQFFRHEEVHEGRTVGLMVSFTHSRLELGVDMTTEQFEVGGLFHALALDIAQRRDPSFMPSPRHPRLPFSGATDLQEAVDYSVALFKDARDAMLAFDGWPPRQA